VLTGLGGKESTNIKLFLLILLEAFLVLLKVLLLIFVRSPRIEPIISLAIKRTGLGGAAGAFCEGSLRSPSLALELSGFFIVAEGGTFLSLGLGRLAHVE
jgi:hypothetical protein